MPKMKTEIDGLELEFEIREVTPQVAQAWMAKNDHNRNVKKRHKAKLTRAMELEEFRFVGDPVRFSAQGRLLDGQHRLLSIIESGKAQLLLIITGFADDDQQYMDSGAIRSAADQVGLVLQKTQPSVWASVARLIIRWDAEDLLTEELTPAPPEINLFIQEHDDAMQRAVRAANAVYSTTRGSKAVAGAAYFMAEQIDAVLAVAFWRQLATGEGLHQGMPVFALRDALLRRRTNQRWRQPEEVAAYVRCWNSARSGSAINRLTLTRGSMTVKDNLTMR